MSNVSEIIEWLQSQRNESNMAGMSRFGINTHNAFGVKMPVLRAKAKTLKKDMTLSRELWKTGFHEARMIDGFIADPKKITEKDMDEWVRDFNSWDICDVVCFGLFCKTDLYDKKIAEYASNEAEYIRRAAFAMIAGLALADKKLPDEAYLKYFELIEKYAFDDRNFVRKAVNWALRQIGKRNKSLCLKALECSHRIKQQPHKSARWIASDAIRELEQKLPKLKK
jgi:3-methyladenine DNA glycosylase AlkD